MKKRTLLIGLIIVVVAVVTSQLASGIKANPLTSLLVDAFFFTLAYVLLGKVPAAENTGRETTRFALGGLVFLVSLQSYTLVVWLLGNADDSATVLLWLYLARLGPILGATWSIRSLLRLGGDYWQHRRKRIVTFGVILVFLVLSSAPLPLSVIVSVLVSLFVIPGKWLEELEEGYRWWLPLLFFIAPVVAIIFLGQLSPEFLNNLQINDPELQESFEEILKSRHLFQENWENIESGATLLTQACLILSIYWMLLPVRILLGAIQGTLGLRIPIWTKMSFTYIFSTIIPTVLLLALVSVAIYAGMGIMRSRMVRTLVFEDLNTLGQIAREESCAKISLLDSVALGVYERSVPRQSVPSSMPPSMLPYGDHLSMVGPGMDRFGNTQPQPSLATQPESPDFTFPGLIGLTSLMSLDEHSGDFWVCRKKLSTTWEVPDTLSEIPGWTDSTRYRTAILPLENNNATYAAAAAFDDNPNMIRVALRRLTPHVLKKYKKVVRTDITILPTIGIIGKTDGGEVDNELRIGSNNDAPAVTMTGEKVLTLSAVSTLDESADSAVSLLRRSMYHGVSELVSEEADGETGHFYGLITVHSSIGQVVSTLFGPEGLSIVILWLLGALTLLLLLAVIISSVLGLGISRSITNAVKRLRVGTEQLRKGDLTTRIQVRSRDELGELAVSFNRMTADLSRMLLEMKEKERLEQEMQIARSIQLNLLPKALPRLPEYEFAATSEPALEVAGDYYDCLQLEDGKILLAVGDVTGKGAAAAMLMSNLQASLRVLISADLDLPAISKRLNHIIYQNSTPDMFITFFVALLDPEENSLTFVNCGHDYPLLLQNGELNRLTSGGLMLGALPSADYEVGSMTLAQGDIFLAYSDGLTEAMNLEEEEFGETRLIESLKKYAFMSANDIKRRILQEVRAFAGRERAAADDLTLLIMKRSNREDGS